MKKCCLALALLSSAPLFGQSDGELRLQVTDPSELGVKTSVTLVCEANGVRREASTDETGRLLARRLPFGRYRLEVKSEGFAPLADLVDVLSAVPIEYRARLRLASLTSSISVDEAATLVDPHGTGAVGRMGPEAISNRPTSLPGRSVAELVFSEPGWVQEGSAVLHPRGSEYQTQFVVDGVPLTDNRSPGLGPEIEADDVEAITVYTAGIPAEYGRKLGGVIEVATNRDWRPGLHGKAVAFGGGFGTAGGYLLTQYTWARNTLGISADGAATDRYLNPPVVENYTNRATIGDFAARYESSFTDSDRVGVVVRHTLSRFLVPNELVQQAAGQRQDRDSIETMGVFSYQHVFGPSALGELRFVARDDTFHLRSNPRSTPIIATQDRGSRQAYAKASFSARHGIHEWKAGVEGDFVSLREAFADRITDPGQFDPETPAAFDFSQAGADREQGAFVQDVVRLGAWTLSAGLRWDHYRLEVNESAVSPRVSLARYFESADLLVHAAYDRVFQTPASENILLASSPEVEALNPNVLRLPVRPSRGNYYELGFSKSLFGKSRLDANAFVRSVDAFADDEQLLNTAVSFPIAFRRASIYGAEARFDVLRCGGFSGSLGYSYMVGSAHLPVTGGLFLGAAATDALDRTDGRFWVTQDQRNTARARVQYRIVPRAWVALGGEYGSGLPVEFDGTEEEAIAQYGSEVVHRVDLPHGRVKPSFSFDLSASVGLWSHEHFSGRLQGDVRNVGNRLNVIDFGGLFSGNAIAPPRTLAMRLEIAF